MDARDSPDSSGQFQHDEQQQGDKDKVKDLFSYLDQVEMKSEKTFKLSTAVPSESDRSEMEFAAEPDYIETVPK